MLEVSGLILKWMSLNKLVLNHFKLSLLCMVCTLCVASHTTVLQSGFCFISESLSSMCTFFHPTSFSVPLSTLVMQCFFFPPGFPLQQLAPFWKFWCPCIVLTATSQLRPVDSHFDMAPDLRIDNMCILESMKTVIIW